jgi:dipeptidyl aminopeptidase/acylaminoacyl peptidase
MITGSGRTRPRRAFAVACLATMAALVIYIAITNWRAGHRTRAASTPRVHVEFIASAPDAPFILFRDGSEGDLYGRIALIRLPLASNSNTDTRLVTPLACVRVYYAAGSGVCMVADETRLPVRYAAYVFDRTFTKRHTIPLTGPPIRARVSADGRRAALTVFETGHSYADESFSTRTIVLDTASGQQLGDLEQFAVRKDGQPFKAIDFNFWGLTFARDGDHFYATLRSGGHRYLIHGSIDAKQAEVMRADVECPSLSPDGTRIVYKKPLQGVLEMGWRLHLLDLATGAEHPLNQVTRSVDDQVDWFDADHIVYHDSAPEGTGIWILSTDGVSPPRLLLPNAYSPAVQR